MYEFKSKRSWKVKEVGLVIGVENPVDCDDPSFLTGYVVMINNKLYEVIGVERYLHNKPFKKGEDIGLLVKEVINMDQQPSVGRIVHYKSFGTPNGEYKPLCRAAIITEFDADQAAINKLNLEKAGGIYHTRVGLCVLNPTGQFFNQGVEQDEDTKRGGTWHWPERV